MDKKYYLVVFVLLAITLCGCLNASRSDNETTYANPDIIPIVTQEHTNDSGWDFIGKCYAWDDDPEPLDNVNNHIEGDYDVYHFDTVILTDMNCVDNLSVYKVHCGDELYTQGYRPGWTGSRYYFNVYNVGGNLEIYDQIRFDESPVDDRAEPDYDLTRRTFESFCVESLKSIDYLMDLTSKFRNKGVVFNDVVLSYSYSISDVDSHMFDSLTITRNYEADEMQTSIVRQEMDGIPITTYTSIFSSQFIAWDQNCLGYVSRQHMVDEFNYTDSIYVPFDVYPYTVIMNYENDITPIWIEDCIYNCIPEISYDVSDMSTVTSVEIYSAELTYLKVMVFNSFSYENSDGWLYWLIPAWKVNYCAEDDEGVTRIGAVFLNAKTGVGMEIEGKVLDTPDIRGAYM